MSARSGLVGKNPPGPIWGHPRPIFPWTEQKNMIFAYFPWWANGPYSPGLGPCCYPPGVGNRYYELSREPSVWKIKVHNLGDLALNIWGNTG